MNLKFLALLSVLFLAGCEEESFIAGPDEVEQGEVLETLHLPRQSASDVHVGVTTNGDISITPTNVTFPERWTVVFQCQHGKFVMDSNSNPIAPDVWGKVKVGDKVRITYHKVYRVVSEDGIEKSRNFAQYSTTDVRKVE